MVASPALRQSGRAARHRRQSVVRKAVLPRDQLDWQADAFFRRLQDTLEIVGIVWDTRTEALSQLAEPEVYLPFWQSGAFSKHLVLRATSDPRALTALVRREVRAVDPTAAVEHATTMEDIAASRSRRARSRCA